MPFYCPTNLVTKWSLFTKQYAEWRYIPTYKLCDNMNDCIDGSDEVFCPKSNNKNNPKVTLLNTLKKSNAFSKIKIDYKYHIIILIISTIYSFL